MDWINVLEGAASIDFIVQDTFLDALQDSRRKSALRAKKDGISDEEAVRCISREFRAGQFVTYVGLFVALAVTLATVGALSGKWAAAPAALLVALWFLPKVAYMLLSDESDVHRGAA